MHSVFLQSTAGGVGCSTVDGMAAQKQALLQGVVRLGREWLDRIPADDPQREHLIRMGILAEDLIRAGDHSPAAMAMARALLCANCRRLGAIEGKCFGQVLERCVLLNSSGA